MTKFHCLKVWPKFYKDLCRTKKFELRKNDRGFKAAEQILKGIEEVIDWRRSRKLSVEKIIITKLQELKLIEYYSSNLVAMSVALGIAEPKREIFGIPYEIGDYWEVK